MSQRRTLILVAAIAIGMVAAFLVYNYVDNVKDDALDNAKLVPVYVAKATIAKGTPLETAQVAIVKENIPQQFKPENAISDPADISGQVAVTDLPTNQILVRDQWVDASDPSARQTISSKLRKINNEDMTAIAIQVDPVRGVAGFIEPGDYVNIMITKVVTADGADGADNPANDASVLFGQAARYLYLKSEVLAVGSTITPSAGASTEADAASTAAASTDRGIITVIVPTRAAQYLASVPSGNFYLTLVADDYLPTQQRELTPNDPIPGETADMITPYGPKGESGK